MRSHRSSRLVDRTLKSAPNFGTYHHTDQVISEMIRDGVKAMFNDAFASLPLGRNAKLKILDMGCGLGFLSCICADFYKNARIKGIDTFEHSSLKDSSIWRARENAKVLGFSDRINFKRADLLEFTPTEKFDVFVSNLVFHNFGKRKRFGAYSRLASWVRPHSFVLIGDLFYSPDVDMTWLSKLFVVIREIKPDDDRFQQYSLVVMSKNSNQESHGSMGKEFRKV